MAQEDVGTWGGGGRLEEGAPREQISPVDPGVSPAGWELSCCKARPRNCPPGGARSCGTYPALPPCRAERQEAVGGQWNSSQGTSGGGQRMWLGHQESIKTKAIAQNPGDLTTWMSSGASPQCGLMA